jgi:hypothetical protein
MQIIINIPEDLYEGIERRDGALETEYVCDELMKAVDNGTPLPKGHGALKDFEKLYAYICEKEDLARQRVIDTPTSSPCYWRYVELKYERTAFKKMLNDAPTIIEADKVESEG